MFGRFFSRNQDLALVGSVISILLILFAPIPSMLLDLLIIFNFAFALTLLLLDLLRRRSRSNSRPSRRCCWSRRCSACR